MLEPKIPIWRDDRLLKILGQAIAVLAVIGLLGYLAGNFSQNTQRLGLDFGWGFLFDRDRPASFPIGDAPIPYQATDPYNRALLVGLLNSLRITAWGIVFASILGISLGIARLSTNWLLQKLSGVYVEIFRNTPLLLQLFFWYFTVFLRLPKINDPLIVWNKLFFSNQGIYLPFPLFNLQTGLVCLVLLAGFAGLIYLWQLSKHSWGKANRRDRPLAIGIGLMMLLGLVWGIAWQFPSYDAQIPAIKGGMNLSPEFATLLVGLTFYTAAFIAEVVRAGIQSVPKGQWEAAQSLGLRRGAMMRLVIFPQALQVMIPPLTNEFLNLAKNSSLAIAIGYNDVYAISSTIANQTGKAVEMLMVVMASYLILNLLISAAMNQLNRRVQIRDH